MSGTYAGAEQPRSLGKRYELGAVLGRGGMAEVFMARDTRLGRAVAVKTLRTDLSRDPTFQARFRREAQSAASLNHPAIVAIYDTGEDFENGISVPYIVMEYADGSTLRDLLHSGRRLLPERALEITAGVLQALDYSHRNGIIHRDIKPANIMLTRAGTVKVMDFGIARAMADNGMTMTQTAAVIGTAQYLSPEQAKGETVDARSDLYSTGCLMYELLTGRPPFVGDSPVAVAYQHVREEPLPPSSYDPEVSPVIDAVVLKSLAKTADTRYQSAAEMRADIERALDGRPTEAQTALLGGSNMPTQRIDPRVMGAAGAAAAGAAMVGNGVGQTRRFEPVQDDRTGYQQQQQPGPASRRGYDDYEQDGRGEPPPARRPDNRRPPEPEPSGGKTGYVILAVAGVAAVIAAVVLFNTLLKPAVPNTGQAVPTITNMNVADAHTTLAAQVGVKFTLGANNCASFTNPTVDPQTGAAGVIIAQSPDPQKTSYAAPGPITYCLATGPKQGTIAKNLIGQTQAVATSNLKASGFLQDPLVLQQASTTVPPGEVIDIQDGSGNTVAGQTVPASTQLTLVISIGPPTFTVPASGLIGLDVNQAAAQLKGLGFTNVHSTPDSSAPAGSVPNSVTRIGGVTPGQTATAGSLITLYVAPQPAAPPPSATCDPNGANGANCQSQTPTGGQSSTQPTPSQTQTTAAGGALGGLTGGLTGGNGGTPPTATKTGH